MSRLAFMIYILMCLGIIIILDISNITKVTKIIFSSKKFDRLDEISASMKLNNLIIFTMTIVTILTIITIASHKYESLEDCLYICLMSIIMLARLGQEDRALENSYNAERERLRNEEVDMGECLHK